MSELLRKIKSSFRLTKLGTFGGVFVPDVLTILGVIMYLRLGWVVGNAGLLGAIIIISLAKIITLSTGLSMASITTNIKIGAGGAYSIISKSLGLEAGGSVGLPFYISQTLSASLYIIGFTEGWVRIFPHHPYFVVAVTAWLVLLVISYVSTVFAIRIQYIILAIIGLSILSFLLTPNQPRNEIILFGNFEDASFWGVFAVFFPAVTGIMAGANLSGDLKDPRKSIPLGTLSAIGVTYVIYIGLAIAAAFYISPGELRTNEMALVDNALYGQLVLAGILAATFSSALGTMIGAPRILQALAEQRTIPFHKIFAQKTVHNEPRNAIVVTGGIIITALLLGNLNALASLITMFFLITYGMLNLVVFIQQSMKIISFRPTFKIPRIVPFTGAFGSFGIMFLIDPVFSVFALIIVVAIYVWLTKKGLSAEWGDLRGGMFLLLAEQASRIAAKFPRHNVAWKPDLLIPIENPKLWAGSLLFIRDITYPNGSIFAFTVKDHDVNETKKELDEVIKPLIDEKLLVSGTVIEDNDFIHGAKLVIQTLQGMVFRPNALFLTLGNNSGKDQMIQNLVTHAQNNNLGVLILKHHPRMAFGLQKDINLWLRDKSPNWHLAILITLQLQLNWEGKINLVTVAEDRKSVKKMFNFLQNLSEQTRLPSLTEFNVITGEFRESISKAPRADINIFGLGEQLPFEFMRESIELTKSTCLFVRDSGLESAMV